MSQEGCTPPQLSCTVPGSSFANSPYHATPDANGPGSVVPVQLTVIIEEPGAMTPTGGSGGLSGPTLSTRITGDSWLGLEPLPASSNARTRSFQYDSPASNEKPAS